MAVPAAIAGSAWKRSRGVRFIVICVPISCCRCARCSSNCSAASSSSEARYTTAVRMSGATSTEVTVSIGSSSASESRSSSSATTCRNTWFTRSARG